MLRFAIRRTLSGIVVILAIAYLSFFAQSLALRARVNQPAPVTEVAREALQDSIEMWKRLPRGELGNYISQTGAWGGRRAQPLGEILTSLLGRSLALLLAAMILGGLVGGLIGILAAATQRRGVSLVLVIVSIVGISTPSFFLGMLLQYLEISLYRNTGIRLLPVGGFGWDSHMVLPVLVLAARPIAQITRLTYVRVNTILEEDYVRTAHAKGLRKIWVWIKHIVPNTATTVFTAMGTSLRFSLSSLPVVELLFGWPGAGKAMLDMLRSFQRFGATVVLVSMGALFVVINIALDLLYRAVDPRLREAQSELRVGVTWWEWLASLARGLVDLVTLRGWRQRRRDVGRQLASLPDTASSDDEATDNAVEREAARRRAQRRLWKQIALGNPALVLGLVMGSMLLVLVVAGPAMARHNPYVSALQVMVDGKPVPPPAAPSAIYPLGTDTQGRDILSLLLVGARRTLSIAFFAVLARLLIGGALGFIAGWFAGSRLDRAIMSLAETVAAFPSLLLAMLIVYAVGIGQGLSAFVIALAAIGWGEVMQTVRSQVMRIKPMEYIEGAVAVGLNEGQILSAHVLPNVWPIMVSLAFLEMGGVLMILGELGFLGVFIGGGFAASGQGLPTEVYYDIPEWSVMLSNSWRSFRSFPWATLYPGLAFFAAILGFTFLGEGLRWLTERLTLSFKTLFNRYTFAAALLATVGVNWMFESSSMYSQHAEMARAFDAGRAMRDVQHLAGPRFGGRLSGSAEADAVAEWLAAEFQALGLQPAGESQQSYFQTFDAYYRNLTAVPTLVLHGPNGETIEARYGVDFARHAGPYDMGGEAHGELVLLSDGGRPSWSANQTAEQLGISMEELEREDRVLLHLTRDAVHRLYHIGYSGRVTLGDRPISSYRYELPVPWQQVAGKPIPAIFISQALFERVLEHSGHTVDELLARQHKGEAFFLPTGWTADLRVPTEQQSGVPVRNVIGFWPGADIVQDSDAIIVSAYYDGLGRFPDGTLYPGANDNASGVATMLEMIRSLKEQGFRPKRTLIFVAWIGGERHEAVDYAYYMKARIGFEEAYDVVSAIALEGVGAGSGNSAVIWHATSERLTRTFRKAAGKVGTRLSTRAAGLHADPELWPDPPDGLSRATISWAGSDDVVHTPDDLPQNLDPDKLAQVGRMTSLAVMVMATDPAY